MKKRFNILLTVLPMVGSAASAQEVRFVACPVYRDVDAGKKSGCWLAEDAANGLRYDVSLSPTKPDWNHAVLVEGKAAAEQHPEACGGVVLDPLRVSVLPQPCTRSMLPAEGFEGRRFVLPRRNVRPLYEDRAPAGRPFRLRFFVIPFDYGSDFVTYQLSDFYLDAASNYALDVQPARVSVIGYAATGAETVSGVLLQEPIELASARAEKVAQWLSLRGISKETIDVSVGSQDTALDGLPFDGLIAPSRRKVIVRVTPANGYGQTSATDLVD